MGTALVGGVGTALKGCGGGSRLMGGGALFAGGRGTSLIEATFG